MKLKEHGDITCMNRRLKLSADVMIFLLMYAYGFSWHLNALHPGA